MDEHLGPPPGGCEQKRREVTQSILIKATAATHMVFISKQEKELLHNKQLGHN